MACALAVRLRARCISVPVFLAPALAEASFSIQPPAHRTFTTSPSSASRRTTGPNKMRGVSAIRSKPPKTKTEVYKYELPVPVHDPEQRALFKMNKNHGLYAFFNEKRQPMVPPDAESQHGRAWTYQELMIKSFDDLHKLYWTCILEANQVATRGKELKRTAAGYGESENGARYRTVRNTMKHIRRVLRYRYETWQATRSLMNEKSVDVLMEEIDAEWEKMDQPLKR